MADPVKAPEVKPRRITFLSIFPEYRIAVQSEAFHYREADDGKMVKVPTKKEVTLAFVDHRATTDEATAADLKERGQMYRYGQEFITTEDLKALLLDPKRRPEGENFIYQMYRRDCMANKDKKTRDIDVYFELGITPDMYRNKKPVAV
jgi:hypothetical protein